MFGKLEEKWSIKDKPQPLVMEELALQVLMNMSEGVILFNDKGKILLYNSTANNFLQIDTSDNIIEVITDIIPAEEHADFNGKLLSLIKVKKITGQFTFQTPDDARHSCECDLILMEQDSTILLIIRKTQQIQTDHLNLNSIFQASFDNALHGLLLTGKDGRIIHSNGQANKSLSLNSNEAIIRFNLDEFQEKKISGIIDEESHKKLAPYLYIGDIKTMIVQLSKRYFEVVTINDIANDVDLTVLRDVTEMVEMMEQLNKHDTLKIVGQLAAGIAHEIRNPMTALKGFIQLLESSVKEDHSMYFGVIMSELQRIETIMTEFLMLAKPKSSAYENVSLPCILKETADLMQAQATLYDIELNVNCKNKGQTLYGDGNRLKQVLINLVKNAIEAISGGGIIALQYFADDLGQHILVKDSGCGISDEHLTKLNEPFYTTKENGTGLGLVVSFKIVEEHGGKIEVTSEMGKGSIFHLLFPTTGDEDRASTHH
ncbi:hypothetical protein E2R51_05810 [Jeotgalibacillus sp. S-D1]|uniref:ATP-binding protein n=1 Tax=Jeotgalibacillus sp. S-D1 TaxID=2552189 RepID=UPI001059BF17|nr:ATP-binding protein [Jeotgalibacillus sp. S-D1]TDL35235.1 hypothetical protein E2R51_05810 [Jeotgalibacillus sp. S-D1]